MNRPLVFLAVRELRRHLLRSAAIAAAIAVGTAGVVAGALLYRALIAAYEQRASLVTDGAALRIENGDVGVPEDLIEAARRLPGIAAVEGLVHGSVRLQAGAHDRMVLLGVDVLQQRSQPRLDTASTVVPDPLLFVSDPDSIAVTRAEATGRGWKVGQAVAVDTIGGHRQLVVRAIFEPTDWLARGLGDRLIVMDLPAAARMLAMEGRVSRVDVRVTPGAAVADVEARLGRLVAARAQVSRSSAEAVDLQRPLQGYRHALAVGCGLAFVVAVYVVVNVMVIAVVHRRRDLEALACLGMTARQLGRLIALEAVMVGLVGCAAGVPLGVVIARISVAATVRGIDLLYTRVPAPVVRVDAASIVMGVVGSLSIALIAAAVAVRSAAPGSSNDDGYSFAAASCDRRIRSRRLLPVGAAVHLPKVTGAVALLVVRTLQAEAGTTAVSASALLVGLAGLVGMAGLLASLDRSLGDGLRSTFAHVDLVVSGGSDPLADRAVPISADVVARIRRLRDVGDIDPVTVRTVPFANSMAAIVASDATLIANGRRGLQVVGADPGLALADLAAGRGVLVTNVFALRYRVDVGDRVALTTPAGRFETTVVGRYLFEPSVGDVGAIRMDRKLYEGAFGDRTVTALHVAIASDTPAFVVARRIERLVGRSHDLAIVTTKDLRAQYQAVLDTLRSLLTPLVAAVGVLGSIGLVAGRVLTGAARQQMLATLRAIGAIGRQSAAVVAGEAILLGAGVGVLGVVAGSLLGRAEVRVLLRHACAIDVPYSVPASAGAGFALALIAIVLVVALAHERFAMRYT